MYHDVLGRNVDHREAYFVSLLHNGTSRPQVVSTIMYSNENLANTVDGYYQFLLARPSDPGGRSVLWVGQLQRGARGDESSR